MIGYIILTFIVLVVLIAVGILLADIENDY